MRSVEVSDFILNAKPTSNVTLYVRQVERRQIGHENLQKHPLQSALTSACAESAPYHWLEQPLVHVAQCSQLQSTPAYISYVA